MKTQELLEYIQDALQRDETLEPTMHLSDVEEWDSLAIISLITLYDGFGIKLSGNTLRECKSVGDLITLAKEKLED